MKLPKLADDTLRSRDTEELREFLLTRVIKLRKLNKQMNEDPQVQKAQDALEMAKQPFKKTRSKWKAEVEAVELELKSRDIKFNIKWDDIFEEEKEE
jgi:hypothetical protein